MKMSGARGKGYERFLEWCNEPMGTGEGDFRDNATKVICAIQLALGDCMYDVPEMGKLRDRLVAAIEVLKAKAAKWEEWESKACAEIENHRRKYAIVGVNLKTGEAIERPRESGPGLRAQGGKYTTPNDETVLVDHGWDE